MTPHDEEEATQPVALDQDDHQAATASRPLPEPDPSERDRVSPDQLPTIGHVGRYALKYCIGEGGLGTVYAAHDPLLSRLIAIKTLQVNLPESDREQFNALFMNEAKAAGSLSHPHIVTLYDAGAGAQGAYIAMELLRGKDLRQLLAIGWRPTPPQAALIVRRVADALSYAHHKGVIHRDIKPANIFMVGRTQPRVLDFGIARLRQAGAEAADDGMSRFGELVGGSPYYMAPEQVRRDPVDRRADVYALGVVLYELLAGRRAFGGNSVDEIHQAVLSKSPKPAHEVNPDVPKALADIAARAMARDLVQRTRSARTLSQELRDWLDGQADVSAQPLPTRDPAAEPMASAAGSSLPGMVPTQPAGLLDVATVPGAARDLTPAWLMAGLASVVILTAGAFVAWAALKKNAEPHATQAAASASMPSQAAPLALVKPAQVVPVAAPLLAPVAANASAPSVVEPVQAAASVASTAPASGATAPGATATGATAPSILTVQAVAAPVTVAVTDARATNSALSGAPALATAPTVTKPVPAPLPKGQLKLAISPWGEVFVNRKAMGVAPPLTQLSLPAGKHLVVIRNGDAPPHSQSIELKPGQSVSITHAF